MNLKDVNFSSINSGKVIELLKTSFNGISEAEAKNRIKIYGENKLPQKKKGGAFFLFLKQFHSLLIYVLFLAAFISWQFEHYIDAYVILVIVFINAIIGFFQRWRAERVLDALKSMVKVEAKVIRDGVKKRILAEKLTVGDIVVLEAGDVSPADIRLIESDDLRVNESSLTGESLPVRKNSDVFLGERKEGLAQNMVFMSTSVISGYSKGVVVGVGQMTKIGSIATEIKNIKHQKSHFEKKVDELVIQMGVIAFLGALATFLIGFYVKGMEFFDIFLFSVASLVAGVPEGLPAVLTIVLAIGASRMAKRNAIIKHLPSVETLGVSTVICTDKTGTLTKNILTVKKIFINSKLIDVSGSGIDISGGFFVNGSEILPKYFKDLNFALRIPLFTSDASLVFDDGEICDAVGDPLEVALEVVSAKGKIYKNEILKDVNILDKIPFDTKYKYKANLINLKSEHGLRKNIFMSGAFEVVLKRSEYFYEDGKIKKLTKEKREEILSYASDMAQRALKVVGVAFKEDVKLEEVSDKDIFGMVFVGLFGMIDPPKDEVFDAIKKCNMAGIKVLMLTGDHKDTAVAIAKDVGLLSKDKDQSDKVVSESDLFGLSDDEFKEKIEKSVIFARVTPQTKLKVAKFLQEKGNIVAMTGDGVNDAPALKQADIGVAMGISGTDVAKEASDIILTDDNFSSIVNAIIEGRIVFSNVKKTSFYLATTNIAETATILTSLSFGMSLPLLPTQLLWLNLVTDGITVIALATEPKQKGILREKPKSKNEKILSLDIVPLLIFTVVLMVVGTISLFLYFLPDGIDKARTVAFTFMAFSQLFNVINMRSLDASIFKIGFFSNRFMVIALLISIVVQFLVIYMPFFQNIFSFVALNTYEWVLIIALSSLILFVVEVYKFFKRRF